MWCNEISCMHPGVHSPAHMQVCIRLAVFCFYGLAVMMQLHQSEVLVPFIDVNGFCVFVNQTFRFEDVILSSAVSSLRSFSNKMLEKSYKTTLLFTIVRKSRNSRSNSESTHSRIPFICQGFEQFRRKYGKKKNHLNRDRHAIHVACMAKTSYHHQRQLVICNMQGSPAMDQHPNLPY
jgi:hypothetical protein